MSRRVQARCGFIAHAGEFEALPAVTYAGNAVWGGASAGFAPEPADFLAESRCGRPAEAYWERSAWDDEGPGGFYGALACETHPVVVFAASPSSDEPIALNLGVADLFLSLKDDLAGLRAAIEALSLAADPGDLTIAFSANL